MALELNGTTGVSLVQDGVITDANLPAGSVLQVVQNSYATQVTNATTSFVDTGLQASITPSSVSSTILVFVSQNGCGMNSTGGGIEINLLRGATSLISLSRIAGYSNSGYTFFGSISGSYEDSPNTTSSVTYKTQFRLFTASGTAYIQATNGGVTASSTITLMEIAG